MVVSIGAVSAPAQGAAYYERDGYYAENDPEHRLASAWAGKGAEALGLSGTVDPDVFKAVLAGRVPDGLGRRLGRRGKEGDIVHRPGRDLTFSAPKSVSLAALVGGDERVVEAHDRAAAAALAWVEENAAETRLRDPQTGKTVRAGGQKTVAAKFRHDVSRNLDPQLHTHAVLANMLQGEDGAWRSMSNETLYRRQKLIGMIYRGELARGLSRMGYAVEKSGADGLFEIAGVSRETIEAFSTRRKEIEAAVAARGAASTAADPRLVERAALLTRARKRDADKAALRESWRKQAEALGFDARALAREAKRKTASLDAPRPGRAAAEPEKTAARRAAEWALAHLSEREAVFSRSDLLGAALSLEPGAVRIGEAEKAAEELLAEGRLLAAEAHASGEGLTTDRALADERETIALMREGRGRAKPLMRSWMAGARLRGGALTKGQREAAKLILGSKDRVVGVQGYAGTGKTTMLRRAKQLAAKNGYGIAGLAPSASAARTLASEAGVATETLQRFLARHAAAAEGRLTRKSERRMREAFRKTALIVDEGSLASTVQARDLLRIARTLRVPRLVLVGDAKQLDAVEAGKPFAQLQAAGMKTAVMDEIMRQRDPDLKAAVEASLAGEIETAFRKLGENVAEAKPDNLAGAVAARWLALSPEDRERTGIIAPSHELRRAVNERIRERLAREGRVRGPAHDGERLVSQGFTDAEKAVAGNYRPGDVVVFHRAHKRLGAEKGEERRVTGVDPNGKVVFLAGRDGETARWEPGASANERKGSEAYRTEKIELRAGDRVRWTANDRALGLVNSHAAEVVEAAKDRVSFRLEDGRRLDLDAGSRQLRHLDYAWASTAHAFQGRTADNVIAAVESRHRHLTTRKSFYVEISRARDRAELVTDNAGALRKQLEEATGERMAALEGVGETRGEALGEAGERPAMDGPASGERAEPAREQGASAPPERADEKSVPERSGQREKDLGL